MGVNEFKPPSSYSLTGGTQLSSVKRLSQRPIGEMFWLVQDWRTKTGGHDSMSGWGLVRRRSRGLREDSDMSPEDSWRPTD
jgi:hypothetical protein